MEVGDKMFNFNESGMALNSFLIYLVILIVSVIITALLVPSLRFESSSALSNNLSDVIGYKEYESSTLKVAKTYINDDNYDFLDNREIIVNIRQLPVNSEIRNNCSGYVRVTKVGRNRVYQVFLHCGSYMTIGYDEKLDR